MTQDRTIHTIVTREVRLRQAGSVLLNVTDTGAILPAQAGADALLVLGRAAGSTIANAGTIAGADSDGSQTGGAGLRANGAITLDNAGLIRGGAGASQTKSFDATTGGAGLLLLARGSALNAATNTGTVIGGAGGGSGVKYGQASNGGMGAQIAAGALVNTGTIIGGDGGGGGGGFAHHDGIGGIGVLVGATATLTNSGLVQGGGGGSTSGDSFDQAGAPGASVVVASGGMVRNTGTLQGGNRGLAHYSGGNLPFAVILDAGATLVNAGTVVATNGGYITDSVYETLNGGRGVQVGQGALLDNTGLITGGNHSFTGEADGAPGAAVELDGGTLITAGTLMGGDGGAGLAVGFGTAASALVVDPGAVFVGGVAAVGGAGDVLALAPSDAGSTGTLTGLGAQFTGFDQLVEQYGARWQLAGSNTLSAGTTTTIDGLLSVAGTLSDAGTVTIMSGGTLSVGVGTLADAAITTLTVTDATAAVGGAGRLVVDTLAMSGGVLSVAATGRLAIGAAGTVDGSGTITLDAGTTLAASGTFASPVKVDGSLANAFGTLDIAGSVMVTGTLLAQDGGILRLDGTVAGAGGAVIDSGGTLLVADTLGIGVQFASSSGTLAVTASDSHAIGGTIAGFATGDLIDVAADIGQLTYAGGVLTGTYQQQIVQQFTLAGTYTKSSFTLASDGHGGTLIGLAGSDTPAGGQAAFAVAHTWPHLL